jgi:hypothetical protein
MRKEVKRSLFVWPATASVTITAMSWFMTFADPVTPIGTYVQRVAPRLNAIALDAGMGALTTEIHVSERTEHGNRAMTMPGRVAEAFGGQVPAPVLDEQQELAGFVEPSPVCEIVFSDIVRLEPKIPARTLENLRNRDTSPVKSSTDVAPALVGPVLPKGWTKPGAELSEPAFSPDSLLPDSIRALDE